MDKTPFQLRAELETTVSPVAGAGPGAGTGPGWWSGLPTLSDDLVTLRELRVSDAPALFTMLSTEEVGRYMSPPPTDIAGFERFIGWARSERAAGRYMCYAVVPKGYDVAVGTFQVHQLDPSFSIGEWGAALGSPFWGTGVFEAAARLMIDFLFEDVGVRRLEARAAVQNGRANGAARKIGAVPEGVARQGMQCRGQYHDQLMWSILAEDWRQSKIEYRPVVH